MTIESGEVLLQYRVVDKIGAGAMGEVYRAEDTRLGRQVAIKLLVAVADRSRSESVITVLLNRRALVEK